MTIQGFRCFPADSVSMDCEQVTCFVGPNGSGKTAVLLALRRMFGVEAADRRVRADDFFLRDDERLADEPSRELRIEVWLRVTGVDTDGDAETEADVAAATFEQMIIGEPEGPLFLRVELAARWTDDGTLDGDVEQQLSWITTTSTESSEIERSRRKMAAADRSLIRAVYVSAVRDPSAEIRAVAGTGLGRLLRSAQWSDELSDLLATHSEDLSSQLEGEGAVASLQRSLTSRWQELYRGTRLADAEMSPPGADLRDVVRALRPRFSPVSGEGDVGVDGLSDGFKSLFSLAFTSALLDVEERIRSSDDGAGFDAEQTHLPILTLLLVEEPENHVSPHHLGRVIHQLRAIAASSHAQVLLTSHAPSVVRRVQPIEIRYCLGDEASAATGVRALRLPESTASEGKYVREAVQAYPELYFSRLVVLGEGASEAVVLPKLLELAGQDLDVEQISVVPLGGRHVNHFWRLLDDLGVPYVTLLDLDRCRTGGGWQRVKYAIDQLIAIGYDRDKLLTVEDEAGKPAVLSESEFAELASRDDSDDELDAWVRDLQSYGVFFSRPLDIDHLMLKAFPEAYKAVASSTPRIPSGERRTAYLEAAAKAVLGEDGNPDYYSDDADLFPWYRALFIHGSKPDSHLAAMASIDDNQLAADCPKPLKKCIRACRSALKPPDGE